MRKTCTVRYLLNIILIREYYKQVHNVGFLNTLNRQIFPHYSINGLIIKLLVFFHDRVISACILNVFNWSFNNCHECSYDLYLTLNAVLASTSFCCTFFVGIYLSAALHTTCRGRYPLRKTPLLSTKEVPKIITIITTHIAFGQKALFFAEQQKIAL